MQRCGLNAQRTTTDADKTEPERWLPIYRQGVQIARQDGFEEGHRQGHREGWAQGVAQAWTAGYEARAREDETFAQAVAERLYREGVRADDRRNFVKWLIESGRAQEAQEAQRRRFAKDEGRG